MPIWLINILVGVVLSVASTLIKQALAPSNAPTQAARGYRGTVQTGGTVPQSFLVGTIGVPGKREYRNTWGNEGETPNAYLVDVLSFGDLPITGFVGLFVNTADVTVSTASSGPQGYGVPEYIDGVGHHLWWHFRDGTETTASAYLTSVFGADPDRPWGSDMIGRGVPQLILTALVDETLWTGFPNYMAVLQGIPLYDPRKDDTAGGEGDHRWDDPSTWEFSDNNLVIVYNLLRGIHYNGAHVWGGSARPWQLPYVPWAAAMDACDAAIPLAAGGTEKAYRAGREIFVNERPADVVREFLTGANARIAVVGGIYYPLVGIPAEADGSFSDADVIVTEATTFDAFPNLDEVINGATASYLEPLQAWEQKETAPYYRSDLEAEDDGRRQLAGLELKTTFSGTQAQRVLKATVEESRRFVRHVVVLPPQFYRYRPLQVLAWTSDANQYEDKLFLITARTIDPNTGNVLLGLQELDPADGDWDPETDESALSFAPLTPIRPPAQEMTGWGFEPFTDFDSEGTGRRFGIEASAPAHQPDVRAARIQVREGWGDKALKFDSDEQPYDVASDDPRWRISRPFLLPNETYEARGKLVPPDGSGRVVNWSEWLPVTMPDIKLTDRDVTVELGNLAGGVLRQLGDVRRLIEQFKQQGTLLEDVDRENFHLRQSVFRSIVVELDELAASFDEVIEVALGPGGAIATALSSLYAALGGNTSQVNVRMQSVAAPAGYSARYAVQAAVNDGTFRSATLFIDVPANPSLPTRIGFMAGQTAFFTSGGDAIALVDEDGLLRSANGAVEINMLTGAFTFGAP